MDSAINPTFGVGIETIKGDFRNFTGGTITKGYVGVSDIYGISNATETVDFAALDGPTSRFSRIISCRQGGVGNLLVRQGWYACLLEDSLIAGATGSWLVQGYAVAVQCLVTAADAAAHAALNVSGAVPSATNPNIYSVGEAVAAEGKLALRDSQGGASANRRGIFAPTTYLGDDVDGLLSGLFLGMSANTFGHRTV